MHEFFHHALPHLIAVHGYWILALVVALESMGLPLPGETVLIAAAIYAGKTHQLNIGLVIGFTALGTIAGATAGFWIGRTIGYGLMLRHGRLIGLTESKLKLGQYMFLRHGGKVVFFGRFLAILRALSAFLAGANRMSWSRFQLFNVSGAVAWATLFGVAADVFGHQVHRLMGPAGIAALVLTILGLGVGAVFLHRHHARLQAEAERALPGPLDPGCRPRSRPGYRPGVG
jgi:membrane protein DedA with SNARE-associated domain